MSIIGVPSRTNRYLMVRIWPQGRVVPGTGRIAPTDLRPWVYFE
jgi:hypothetical protein